MQSADVTRYQHRRELPRNTSDRISIQLDKAICVRKH
jgi:hypothetical protein